MKRLMNVSPAGENRAIARFSPRSIVSAYLSEYIYVVEQI